MQRAKTFPNDDESVRLWLRAQLGEAIDNLTLRLLKAGGSLGRCMENPTPENRAALVAEARRFTRRDPGRKKGQTTRVSMDMTVEPEERRRAEVCSRHLSRHASRQTSVIEIRERFFGGGVLTREDAKRFIRQLGPRFFSLEWFAQHGIPLLEHSSYYHGPEFGTDEPVRRESQQIRFYWDGNTFDVPDYADLRDFAAHYGLSFELPSEFPIRVVPTSVLGVIQRAASHLATIYGWLDDDAAQFILTGTAPPVFAIALKPVRAAAYHIALELLVQPWVSAKSVVNTYAQIQKASCDPMRKKDEKQVELFEHVESSLWNTYGRTFEELSEEELDNQWPQITELWNASHGRKQGWEYDTKRLREAFLRVRLAIAKPPCGSHRRRNK